jgi:hypothetical protein
MDWDTVIFGTVTSGQLIVVCSIIIAVMLYIRWRRKKEYSNQMRSLQNTVFVLCNNCDWQGHISKYGTQCPKCTAVITPQTPK